MASQSNDNVALSLIHPSRREVLWPSVFGGVKNVVRSNNLNSETLACIKGWLKSNDSQLHVPLLGLTVMHTISLNCSNSVRNQLAVPKLFQRLEKQLARPQGPQVATAIVQVLVDWQHLFPQEELGARSRALLAQPRFGQMAAGCSPSPAVLAMQEEVRLGIPPVAPIRGEDFIRWMYRGAGSESGSLGAPVAGGLGFGAPPGSGGGGPGPGGGASSPLAAFPPGAMGLPGGAPPAIVAQEVPHLCQRMRKDAARLTSALAACRAAAAAYRMSELSPAMDAAYREAERCSQWRRRVQEFSQHSDDAGALAAVLAATDEINQALQTWQSFTGREVYDTMRIVVPPMPPAVAAAAAAAAARGVVGVGWGTGPGTGGQAAGSGRAQCDVDVLLGIAPSQPPQNQQQQRQQQQQQQPADPFAGMRLPDGGSAGAAMTGPAGSGGGGTPKGSSQLPVPSNNPFTSAGASSSSTAAAGAVRNGVSAAASGSSGGNGVALAASPRAATSATAAAANLWSTYGTVGMEAVRQQSGSAAAAASAAAGRPLSQPHHRPLQPSLSDWDPFGPPSLPPGLPAAGSSRGGGSGNQAMAALGNSSTSSGVLAPATNWALFGDDDAFRSGSATAATSAAAVANGGGPFGGTFGAMSPGGLSSSQPSGLLASGPTSPISVTSTPAPAWANGTTSASKSELSGGNLLTGGSAAAAATARPATPQPPGTTAPAPPAAAAAAGLRPQPLSAGTGSAFLTSNGQHQSAAAASGSSSHGLDWRPEFERLASDLRSMLASSASSAAAAAGGGGTAASSGGLSLPAVLSRVQGLCEALAAQHARQLASVELRLSGRAGGAVDGGGGGGSRDGGGGDQGPRAAGGATGQGGGAALGWGSGFGMGAGGSGGSGSGRSPYAPLSARLQQQTQQQTQTQHQHQQQPFKLNSFEGLGFPAGSSGSGGNGGGNGSAAGGGLRGGAAGVSLI